MCVCVVFVRVGGGCVVSRFYSKKPYTLLIAQLITSNALRLLIYLHLSHVLRKVVDVLIENTIASFRLKTLPSPEQICCC